MVLTLKMKGEIKDHKGLIIWVKACELAKEIYEITSDYPKSELFNLVSQMRRAAISVPSNIAEGAARQSTKEFIRYLQISSGSLSELETQLILSAQLGLLNQKQKELTATKEKILILRKQIYATIRSLRAKS